MIAFMIGIGLVRDVDPDTITYLEPPHRFNSSMPI
jgi:hypothetical protein